MSTVKDISRMVGEKHGLARTELEQFVTEMFELLRTTIHEDGQVKIKGLGTFKIQTVKSRSSINVNTGERVIIDSHDKITFTPDKAMAESVNKPFGHFETVVLNDGVVFDDMEDVVQEQQAVAEQYDDKSMAEPQPSEAIQNEVVKQEVVVEEVRREEPIREETVNEVHHELVPQEEVAEVCKEDVEEEPVTNTYQQNPVPEKNTTEVQEEEVLLEDEDKAGDTGGHKVAYILYAVLLAAFFVAGFFTGRMTTDTNISVVNEAKSPVRKTVVRKVVKVVPKPKTIAKADTVKVEHDKKENLQPKTVAEPVERKESESTSYNSDPRVRTGAYIITGIEKTVTVESGQTLESLSKRHLGPGMECYVEAVNGGAKEVREGQKVKIPSLKLKKKQ